MIQSPNYGFEARNSCIRNISLSQCCTHLSVNLYDFKTCATGKGPSRNTSGGKNVAAGTTTRLTYYLTFETGKLGERKIQEYEVCRGTACDKARGATNGTVSQRVPRRCIGIGTASLRRQGGGPETNEWRASRLYRLPHDCLSELELSIAARLFD